MDSILTSVKKLLGIEDTYEQFDPDIIMHINSVFMILSQLGVGPAEGFSISDKTKVWNDFLGANSAQLEPVKSYTVMKVRMLFDPPVSSSVSESMNRLISELEWRIMTQVELFKE